MHPKNTLLSHGDIPDWAFSSTESILASLRAVDPTTFYHCLRVGEYARHLARAMGLPDYQQRLAQFSGLLHDVGKMGVDQAIIHKPGKLTELEYDAMKSHSVLSEEIIRPMAHHEFFQQVLPAVRGHHERMDGEGYPDKKIGDEIPLLSRLILVVDTLDAMTHDRAYRKGLPIDVVYRELIRCSGSQFDMNLVKVFLESHKHWQGESADRETLARVAPSVTNLKAA
ncbi:MAG: HD-GYP domain-containing protein [Bdellovibrionaceae bacterium]|nr:HD-GYP domain-containing protein [Pseudobdellovibrionaceae bacterium]